MCSLYEEQSQSRLSETLVRPAQFKPGVLGQTNLCLLLNVTTDTNFLNPKVPLMLHILFQLTVYLSDCSFSLGILDWLG